MQGHLVPNKGSLSPISFHVAIPANCVNGHCVRQVIFAQKYLVYPPQVQSLVDMCYDVLICKHIGDCPVHIEDEGEAGFKMNISMCDAI